MSEGITANQLQAGVIPVYSETRILTNAQIKALPSTPIELVAAQGANKIIVPTLAVYLPSIAVAYDPASIDDDGYIAIESAGGATYFYAAFNESGPGTLTVFLSTNFGNPLLVMNTAPAQLAASGWGILSNGVTVSQAENSALQLVADNGSTGDYTLGDPANQLIVSVEYRILNKLTGLFE